MHYYLIPFAFFAGIISYFCLKSAWTDPGILPRNTSPVDTIKVDNPDEYDESGEVVSKLLSHKLNDNFIIGKQVRVEGQLINLKYCHTCQLFRPPRASHCHYCDNCVEEFDHHCPWVSNCVGRRNYRDFIMFVFSLSMGSFYYSFFLFRFMLFFKTGFRENLKDSSFSVASTLFLLVGLIGLVLFCLFAYHLVLICYDLTTAEHVKKSKNSSLSWKTCSSNFYRVFFHPIPESRVPWEIYTHNTKHVDYGSV